MICSFAPLPEARPQWFLRQNQLAHAENHFRTAARLDPRYARLLSAPPEYQQHATVPPRREIGYDNVMKNRIPEERHQVADPADILNAVVTEVDISKRAALCVIVPTRGSTLAGALKAPYQSNHEVVSDQFSVVSFQLSVLSRNLQTDD